MIERIKCVGAFVGAALYVIVVCAILALSAVGAFAGDANGNPIVIGGRPSGCPHAYCGCGLRKYLGIDDKRLDLAWNWAKMFPRTTAHSSAVAVWHHHVALIEQAGDGLEMLLRDFNSGGGLTRLHWRSVKGAVFVNPSPRWAGQ